MNIIGSAIAGDTARLVLPLLEDGAALNGTGFSVTDLEITASDGTQVVTTGDFGWSDQPGGKVYYDPDADDFVASKSPYAVRALLTDGAGKTRHYPNGAPAFIVVRNAR
jgi:hypothetical protein